jgi:hypothetical protein
MLAVLSIQQSSRKISKTTFHFQLYLHEETPHEQGLFCRVKEASLHHKTFYNDFFCYACKGIGHSHHLKVPAATIKPTMIATSTSARRMPMAIGISTTANAVCCKSEVIGSVPPFAPMVKRANAHSLSISFSSLLQHHVLSTLDATKLQE